MIGKVYLLQFLVIFCLIISVGCGSSDDLANPFDPDNPRTAGSPSGLKLTPGDRQVLVEWNQLDYQGVSKYRIYRQFTGDIQPKFTQVGEVSGKDNQYVDQNGILNDQLDTTGEPHLYIYRVSYVDVEGVETPNPKEFQTDDTKTIPLWPSQATTPSTPPPKPKLLIDKSRNLIITLIWKDYPVPGDFKEFRIFSTTPGGSKFDQVGRPYTLESPFFFSDPAFNEDGESKQYRLVAYDKFGVPSITEVEASVGHIPPQMPLNLLSQYRSKINGKYDVALRWEANVEKDLKGYQIYSTKQDEKPVSQGGELAPRRFLSAGQTFVLLENEGWLLNKKMQLIPKLYYVAAVDKTPRPDTGLPDEGMMAAAPPPPGFEDLVEGVQGQ